ncbi:diguanylate cyclase [bacterium]|nr:diguanylate cyclase [bacterium]
MIEKQCPRVLVVDDEPHMRSLLQEIICDAGYECDVSENGEKALQMIINQSYDLVISDVKMPRMQGIELLQHVKKTAPRCAVLIITAFGQLKQAVEAIKIGAENYITKPFDTREIIARIKSMVRIKSLHDELRLAKNDLLELAVRDSLTNTYNRRYFLEILLLEIKKARRYGGAFACLMLDVDHFKKINDTYGHPCGDKVLKRVAEIMRDNIRDSDVVGRYGGDEFIAFLPNIKNIKELRVICNRIRNIIQDVSFDSSNGAYSVTASIGARMYSSSDIPDSERLIEEIDAVLYSAKHSGRNCCKVI